MQVSWHLNPLLWFQQPSEIAKSIFVVEVCKICNPELGLQSAYPKSCKSSLFLFRSYCIHAPWSVVGAHIVADHYSQKETTEKSVLSSGQW